MAPRSPVKRILAALGAFDVADRPMSRLDAARRLREAAEELEAAQVEAARKAGATWLEIGACYGLTKQGAQQRFRATRDQAKAPTAAPPDKAGPDKAALHKTGPDKTAPHKTGPDKTPPTAKAAAPGKAVHTKKTEPAA